MASQMLGPCHTLERSGLSCMILASTYYSLGCCGSLGGEQAGESSVSLSFCFSNKLINKKERFCRIKSLYFLE